MLFATHERRGEATLRVSIRKLLGIYSGEERGVARFGLLGFLWMFAAVSGLKFADVLFLTHIGAEELPTVYTLNACGMMILASLWLTAFERLRAATVSTGIICGGIVLYTVAFVSVSLGVDAPWLWYGLRVVAYLFFVVVITSYWIFVDQYHHIRDAKRLYCLFCSAIFGGSATTGLVMRMGFLSIEALLAVVLVTLCVVLVLLRDIARKTVPVLDESDAEITSDVRQNAVWTFIREIAKSPYALLLMIHCFLIELFTWTTEYSYLLYFDQRFVVDAAIEAGAEAVDSPLAQFLGQLILWVGVANLVFGLFFFNKIVRRWGIYSLMWVSPILLFVTFSNWLYSDFILFPIMGFFMVEGTRWVVDDNGFNLLLSGVPSRLKYQVRVATEHFFEPIAMLISGVLLGWWKLDPKLLTLFLSALCAALTLAMRVEYLPAIFANLRASVLRLDLSIRQRWNRMRGRERDESFQALRRLLRDPDSESRLLACQASLDLGERGLLNEVLAAGASLDWAHKIAWFDALASSVFAPDSIVLDTLRQWLSQDLPTAVRMEVHYYLACQGMLPPQQVQHDVDNPELMRRASAIVAIKKATALARGIGTTQLVQNADISLKAMLDAEDPETVSTALRVIGDCGSIADIARLLPIIKYGEPDLAGKATSAVAKIIDSEGQRYAPTLLGILRTRRDTRVRVACLRSIGRLKQPALAAGILEASQHFRARERRAAEEVIADLGLRCVPVLVVTCRDAEQPDPCRLLAAQALGRLAPEHLRSNLRGILREDIKRAYRYFYYYHTIETRDDGIDLHVMKETLLSGYYATMDFVLHLLGIAGSLEDWELLSTSLRSRSARTRSQVLEALETTCDPELFRMLEPLLEDHDLAIKMQACEDHGCSPLQLNEVLAIMAKETRLSDRVVASAYMRSLDLPSWRDTLRQQMHTDEEIFHHFAYEMLDEDTQPDRKGLLPQEDPAI